MKTNFFTIVFLLWVNYIFSQNLGDYRTSSSGNWADFTKWQVYTATGWLAATQYPGQTSGNYTVSISDGHTITVGTYGNGNNVPTVTSVYNFGDLVVFGQITLNCNLELNNTSNLLLDAGTIVWNQNNVFLKLKENAEVSIINTGEGPCNNGSGINGYGFIGASCSNQNSLIIGDLTYSNCVGSGNAIAGTFCDVNESGGTINAIPTASSNNICHNQSLPSNNSVTLTAPNNFNITVKKTYDWYLDSYPAGFTGFTSINNPILTVNNLIPGTYVFRLKISIDKAGNSYSAQGTTTVIVYQAIQSGSINNLNICSKFNPNNQLNLSGYFGNIVKWQSSSDINFTNNVTDIANTQNSLIIPNNFTTDTYYRAVLSNGNCNGYSAVALVNSISTTYNGTWSNGTPDATKRVILASDFVISSDISACSVEIINNAQITIPSGKNLTINGELDLTSGSMTVESDANLIQINDNAQNTGNITVKRTAKLKRLDYNYWGAPVNGQIVKNFSPNTLDTRFYVYNETNDYFDGLFVKNLYPNNTLSLTNIENKNTYSFVKGKGYAIRSPNNYSTSYSTIDWTFFGNPNNGSITIPIQKSANGFNLIGNPFPSNISFTQFYNANASTINPIAYFWTNVNPNPPIMQGSSYNGANYAIRNLTDGIPAQNQPVTEKPTDAIVTGQGFIIQKTNLGNSNLVFNNSMRIPAAGKFFNAKISADSSAKLWLKLATPAQNYLTILIGYVKGATNGIDIGYDSENLAESSDMFYSLNLDKKLAIQGRNEAFSINDAVPLGVKLYETGNYEISISKVEGIFKENQTIYLKDKKLNKIINLSEGAYQFYAEQGVADDRFEIIYRPETTLGINNNSKNTETLIYENNENIFIENESEKLKEVQVFDASGRLITRNLANSNLITIEKSKLNIGLLVFKIILNSKTTTKKYLLK